MEEFQNNYVYVLVAGGREFADRPWMERQIDAIIARNAGSTVRIVHGGARGADRLAGEVAAERGLEVGVFAADWDRHGRSAGYRRNERMARFLAKKARAGAACQVVLFPGGKGTGHMRTIAKAHRLPVFAPVAQQAPVAPVEVDDDFEREAEADRIAQENWERAFELAFGS